MSTYMYMCIFLYNIAYIFNVDDACGCCMCVRYMKDKGYKINTITIYNV